jgi:[ribosomal protein S18]-alanine N-acetyltransferase
MIGIITRLFAREAAVSQAGPADARALAALHAASFHRGWSEDEFDRLLSDRHVVAHRAMAGAVLAGFILSRLVRDEAEILSIAVASARQGRGLARQLLDTNLRRLAALGARSVFLEVEEGNVSARRLYRRAGFREVGRREAYYAAGQSAAALVLRRDLP